MVLSDKLSVGKGYLVSFTKTFSGWSATAELYDSGGIETIDKSSNGTQRVRTLGGTVSILLAAPACGGGCSR